jgi:hypothetical protein
LIDEAKDILRLSFSKEDVIAIKSLLNQMNDFYDLVHSYVEERFTVKM